ncbi:3'-5' exonuclease [Tamlana fucoidanivorans]|uniref:3'-5' exonuclease n=1 Tax=Allotamlana fucoidanivorans TaxID=2583814 RepID=A0A5C4SH74_9FLAO|nr:3'-5' exonuclease [Tamlana fucoidanivorans]TNJ42127.1 3'-5' exonuclease [Tamlana fucoidanivorans]
MVFNWFQKKKKSYPDFWETYLSSFKDHEKQAIPETRFVAFDTETTGFDSKKDRILSIGAVAFKGKSIPVNNTLELYLKQDVFNPKTVEIHEIIKNNKLEKVTELEAIKIFLDYIKDAVLIAHHAKFDQRMMNAMLARHGLGELKNECIDTGTLFNKSKHIIYKENLKDHYSLDDLCTELNVAVTDRHTASGDALITAFVFLKTLARLDKRKHLQWEYLLSR